MKKFKKLLCVLLVYCMMVTPLAVGASAYADYKQPSGTDEFGKPTYDYEQCCSMVADFIDKMLYNDVALYEEIDIVVAKITIDITSIDSTYKTVEDLLGNGLVGAAQALGGVGDLGYLNEGSIKGIRRTKHADSVVLSALFNFLAENNRKVLIPLVKGTKDWGLIDSFLNEPMLNDLPGFIKETIYTELYNALLKPEADPKLKAYPVGMSNTTWVIDDFLQEIVYSLVLGPKVTVEQDGHTAEVRDPNGAMIYLPSLTEEKLDLDALSFYDLVQNIIDAVMADILCGELETMLIDALDIVITPETPYGDPSNAGLFPTVAGLLVDLLKMDFPYDSENEPVLELRKMLKWLLVGEDIVDESGNITGHKSAAIWTDIIQFSGPVRFHNTTESVQHDGLHISDKITDTLDGLLNEMDIGSLLDYVGIKLDGIEFPDLRGKEHSVWVTELVKVLVPQFLDGVRIPQSCSTVQECLTYIMIGLVMDLFPETDYYGLIEDGTLNPKGNAWIEIGADYLIYLMESLLPIDVERDPTHTHTLENLLDAVVNYGFDYIGFAFNTRQDFTTMTVWEKLDATVFTLIDPSFLTISKQITYTSGELSEEYTTYSEAFIRGYILGSVERFDIQTLISFIGKNNNPDAILQKPLVEFILAFLDNVLGSVFNYTHDFIRAECKTLEALTYNLGGSKAQYLGDLVYDLLDSLKSEKEYFMPTLIPLLGELMGAAQFDIFSINAPSDYPNKTVAELKELMSTVGMDNTGLRYVDEGYSFSGQEDCENLYQWDNFETTYRDCLALIARYNVDKKSVTALEIKNLYYRLGYYYDIAQANPRKTVYKLNLKQEFALSTTGLPETNDNGNGEKLYTDRSWRHYQEALSFANKVMDDDNAKQSMVTTARQQLFNTANRLEDYVALANYSALLNSIEKCETDFIPNYKQYTSVSYNKMYDVYTDALAFVSESGDTFDYPATESGQAEVDTMNRLLRTAMNELDKWELNYQLGADIEIDDTINSDSSATLRFSEGTGADISNVSASVDSGAEISEMYRDNHDYCWTITPGTAKSGDMIKATVTFTQTTTQKTYQAYAYTFIVSGSYSLNYDMSSTHIGKVTNNYTMRLQGIHDSDISDPTGENTIVYSNEHSNKGDASPLSNLITSYVYVDTSLHSDMSQVPDLKFVFSKTIDSWNASYAYGSTFTDAEIKASTSSNTITCTGKGTLASNQASTATFGFAGPVPAAGTTEVIIVNPYVTLKTLAGGETTSSPSFKLGIIAVDKSALRNLVNECIASCRQKWFYSGGWDIYVNDLEDAISTLNKPAATQAQIDEATENLEEAISWLEFTSADYAELQLLLSSAKKLNPEDYFEESYQKVADAMSAINNNLGVLDQAMVDDYYKNLQEAIANLESKIGHISVTCIKKGTDEILATKEFDETVGKKVIVRAPEVIGYVPVEDNIHLTVSYAGHDLVIVYEPEVYRVSFSALGGEASFDAKEVVYDSEFGALPTCTRDGYKFLGWYTKTSGGYQVTEETMVTDTYSSVLYARWERSRDNELASNGTLEDAAQSGEAKTFIQRVLDFLIDLFAGVFANIFGI